MFSSRASLGPTRRRTYGTYETPALGDWERVIKKVGQKGGDEKE